MFKSLFVYGRCHCCLDSSVHSNQPTGITTRQYAYSKSQKLCTWFVLCCILLWFGNNQFYPYCLGLPHCMMEQSYDCPNSLNSQIPACTCSISHNALFRTEMCAFLFWIVGSGIWNKCIQGFVKLVNCVMFDQITAGPDCFVSWLSVSF